jgi:hypothetical protein
MSNRLYVKGYWEVAPKSGAKSIETGYVTRKAAVAIGTKQFGFVGMDIRPLSQFIKVPSK